MKKLLGILVLGLLFCNNSFAEQVILTCKFNKALDWSSDSGLRQIDSSWEEWPLMSKDTTVSLDYKNKSINNLVTPIWNDTKIVGKLIRDLGVGEQETTLTLDRYTGELEHEMKFTNGTTTLYFKCSKTEKKF